MNFLIIFYSLFFIHTLSAITFSDESSTIKVQSGANLTLNQPLNNCNGTISTESGGIISGSSIYFSEGRYADSGTDVALSATFNPAGTITLAGSDIIRSTVGQFLNTLAIQGSNNRVEGQPYIFNAITLSDLATTVTFALQSTVHAPINLNSGTVMLEDALHFNGGNFFVGPGTINANNNSIFLEGGPLTITTPLLFQNAHTITFKNPLTLSSTLSFGPGSASLQGAGNTIQLTSSGKLALASGSTLYISDLTLRGLGASSNPFIFSDTTSQIYFSNVTLEFDNNVTTTMGKIFVKGPTTAALGSSNWTLNGSAFMTIDGTTLWQDPLDQTSGGALVFGTPTSSFLSLVNSGTIKTPGSASSGGVMPDISTIINIVIGNPAMNLSGSVTFSNQKITDLTIDTSNSLDLTLGGNTEIYLNDSPIVLKTIDTLHVTGTKNIVYVSSLFTINGTVSLDPSSELIFEFIEQGDIRTIVFSNPAAISNQITLDPYSVLTFQQYGTIILDDGIVIKGNGTTDIDKPQFIVQNDSELSVEQNAQATFSGGGTLQILHGGLFSIQEYNHVIMTGNFDLYVKDGDLEVAGVNALLSIANNTCTLIFNQDGELYIGNRGTVELNLLNGRPAPGFIKNIEFKNDGVLTIEYGGTLLIGDNSTPSSLSISTEGGRIEGNGGALTYAGQPEFSGVALSVSLNLTNISASKLVGSLLQQQQKLTVSTLFVDQDNNKYLRLKNGLIVLLQPGDYIMEDVSTTGFVYGRNGKTSFFIDLNGTRRTI